MEFSKREWEIIKNRRISLYIKMSCKLAELAYVYANKEIPPSEKLKKAKKKDEKLEEWLSSLLYIDKEHIRTTDRHYKTFKELFQKIKELQ